MPKPKRKIPESENANGPLSRREGAMGPVESLEDCLFVGLMVPILQLVVPSVGLRPIQIGPVLQCRLHQKSALEALPTSIWQSSSLPHPLVLRCPRLMKYWFYQTGPSGPTSNPDHISHIAKSALRCLLIFRSGHPGGWALSCGMLFCPRVLESLEGPPRGSYRILNNS